MNDVKKRNWAIVCYPESLPENWLDILEQTHLKIAISPLHDKDVNESTKETKKPHYHVLVCYENTTTYSNVKSLSDKLNAPIPQPIESVRGAFRYLTHKDNPEKAQYSESDLILLNGFNIQDFAELTKGEILKLKKQLIQIIKDNEIVEYSDLINSLYDNDLSDLLDVATSTTIFCKGYIDSIRNKEKQNLLEIRKYLHKAYKELYERNTNGLAQETIKKLEDLFGDKWESKYE